MPLQTPLAPTSAEETALGRWTRVRLALVAFFLIAPPIFAIPLVGDWFAAITSNDVAADLSPPGINQLASPANSRGTTKAAPAKTVTATSARSQDIQRQLHQLGATYMLLEQYENPKAVFRFICHVDRVEGGRRFEAQSATAAAAMEEVLEAVRNWAGD